MRIGVIEKNGRPLVGLIDEAGQSIQILPLAQEHAERGVLGFIEASSEERRAWVEGAEKKVPFKKSELVAPFPVLRRNVFCVGRNYHEHAKELSGSVFKSAAKDVLSWPIVFTKVPESVVGPYADVRLPDASISSQIDYEAELAIVIGRGGKNIQRGDALKHVFGYTVVKDVTARDVQMRHAQWDLGKSFDDFCPMGPWVATADAFDGTNTRVRCWVNGELRQDGHTRDLIFSIPELIETCSRGITLYPGDIIATGTPAGVGMGQTPPVFLGAGDQVRIEIEGLGEIENRFV